MFTVFKGTVAVPVGWTKRWVETTRDRGMDTVIFSHHIVSGPGLIYSSYRRAEVAIILGDFATFNLELQPTAQYPLFFLFVSQFSIFPFNCSLNHENRDDDVRL